MRWLAFLFCALALVVGQFGATWSDAARYDRHIDIMPSDWAATNVWLESAECAFSRGAWLSICDGDRLVPISEHAIADDPGHALLLGLWSSASNRRATLADVARLNTALNTIGLLALAGLLFALRAYTTSIVLLALGPVEYLGWMGTSPHWSYIGIVSMAAVLPIALLAREEGMLPGWRGRAWLAAGLASLAIAMLVREAIGIMAFVVGAGVIAALAVRRLRAGHSVLNLLVAALLIFVAMATPTWVVMARDASFAMEPAQRLQTHGLSHTLYLGLGVVENRLGIRYDDDFGAEAARRVAPDVVFCSPEYFRIMWKLYGESVMQDPIEVARIYFEKAWLILGAQTMHPGPPFGLALAFAAAHLVLATLFGAWRRIGFAQGFIVEIVALAFPGLFVAQAVLALPSHAYAVPANAFLLVLLGVIVEFFGRAIWVLLGHRLTKRVREAS